MTVDGKFNTYINRLLPPDIGKKRSFVGFLLWMNDRSNYED